MTSMISHAIACRLRPLVAGSLVLALLSQVAVAVAQGADAADPQARFTREVGPYFEAHCVSCHGEGKQKGSFRIDKLSPDVGGGAVVAESTLRSYDQVNDRKSGPLLAVESVQAEPGSSGVRIRFKPSLMLEGFRPGRIIRVFPASWPVRSLPVEEGLFPERD